MKAAGDLGAGAPTRAEIGEWIAHLIPVETLVIERYARWRPLVRDGFAFLFSHLSEERLNVKIAEQFAMGAATTPRRGAISDKKLSITS